jgi:hypothetical protein
MSRSRLTGLLATLAFCLAAVGVARATTGATIGFPAPKFKVPIPVSEAFEGRYLMTSVGRGANIRDGEMKIEISGVDVEGEHAGEHKAVFPVGAMEISEYNPTGQTEIALYSIYPFRLAHGGLTGTILSQGLRFKGVGKIELQPPAEHHLAGEIWLHEGGPYPVEFTELGENEDLEAKRPEAKQMSEGVGGPTATGWGASASEYEGEYELADTAPDPTAEASLLGPVIRVAEGVGSSGTLINGGSMTVTGGRDPGAVLTIESGGDKKVLHLTELAWQGDLRVAKVVGASGAAASGEFRGDEVAPGEIDGTVSDGPVHYKVEFRRTSGGSG